MPDFSVIHGEDGFTVVHPKTNFEVRCEKARKMLLNWTLLQHIPADDESRKEERTQCKNKIFVALSDPLQVGLDKLLTDPVLLEDFVQLVCAMYGDDATKCAFMAMELDTGILNSHRGEVDEHDASAPA